MHFYIKLMKKIRETIKEDTFGVFKKDFLANYQGEGNVEDWYYYDLSGELKAYFKHVNWVALAYRSYKAIALTAGFKIQKIYIAYSYEANLSPVIKYNTGTHGLHIGINLGVRRLEGFW